MLQPSVIIPTRRLGPHVDRCVAGYRERLGEVEVIVVEAADGEPARGPEGSFRITRDGVRLISARAGRGIQCNAGAQVARGDLLIFLHDDCVLPADAMRLVNRAFAERQAKIACFRLRFDDPHWLLGVYGWVTRYDSLLTSFGDQGILIRRELFDSLGGFPDWPVFEDVELLRRARRRARVHKLPGHIVTSAVRFRRNGILRQQLLNALLILRYLAGTPPSRLAELYERER